MSTPVQTISSQAASLFASLAEAQLETGAIDAFSGGSSASGSSSTSSTGSGIDFASLLSDVLSIDGSGTSSSSLLSALGSGGLSGLSPTVLNALLGSGSASGSSSTGTSIAQSAISLANDLTGPNNTSFNPVTTPQAAQQVWNNPQWGNGNVQCVAFVAGAYQQAGVQLPATPNAVDFWSAYANRAGFSEIPNGQGTPQPGDIIVMGGGTQGYGHVAIVTAVIPPSGTTPGELSLAQANSPASQANMTIAPSGAVESWQGMPVLGFIRSQQS